MARLVYAGILGASLQSRISCHSVLRNFFVTILSFGPPVIQMLLLSVWSLLQIPRLLAVRLKTPKCTKAEASRFFKRIVLMSPMLQSTV